MLIDISCSAERSCDKVTLDFTKTGERLDFFRSIDHVESKRIEERFLFPEPLHIPLFAKGFMHVSAASASDKPSAANAPSNILVEYLFILIQTAPRSSQRSISTFLTSSFCALSSEWRIQAHIEATHFPKISSSSSAKGSDGFRDEGRLDPLIALRNASESVNPMVSAADAANAESIIVG